MIYFRIEELKKSKARRDLCVQEYSTYIDTLNSQQNMKGMMSLRKLVRKVTEQDAKLLAEAEAARRQGVLEAARMSAVGSGGVPGKSAGGCGEVGKEAAAVGAVC